MKSPDVIVIGGGLAGSAAAISLQRNGKKVLLLEKEPAAHHKVCGEFISYEAVHYLEDLGVNLDALPNALWLYQVSKRWVYLHENNLVDEAWEHDI